MSQRRSMVCDYTFGGKIEIIDFFNVCFSRFQNDKATKGRKSKSPRVSTIDRTREESEAITKVTEIILQNA